MTPAEYQSALELAGVAYGIYERAWARVQGTGNNVSDAQRRRQAGERAVRSSIRAAARLGMPITEEMYQAAFREIRAARTAAATLQARRTDRPLGGDEGGRSPVPFGGQPWASYVYRVSYNVTRQRDDGPGALRHLFLYSESQLSRGEVLGWARGEALARTLAEEDSPLLRARGGIVADPEPYITGVFIR